MANGAFDLKYIRNFEKTNPRKGLQKNLAKIQSGNKHGERDTATKQCGDGMTGSLFISIFVNQYHNRDLGSESGKDHLIHFARPISSLYQICKLQRQRFGHEAAAGTETGVTS